MKVDDCSTTPLQFIVVYQIPISLPFSLMIAPPVKRARYTADILSAAINVDPKNISVI